VSWAMCRGRNMWLSCAMDVESTCLYSALLGIYKCTFLNGPLRHGVFLVPRFVLGEKWRFGDTNTKLVLMTGHSDDKERKKL